MLAKSNRLTTELFKEIVEKGRAFHGPFFILRAEKDQDASSQSRFGVSVPKKVLGTAISRNKMRRQVYSAIRKIGDRLRGGFRVVLILKKEATTLSYIDLSSEIEKIFVKSGIMK